MIRSILPKLAWALSDALVINPADQNLSAWQWVTAWAPILPLQPMIGLFEAHFFPKWHDVLRAWLMQGPNYEEISNWYLNWKVRVPCCFKAINQCCAGWCCGHYPALLLKHPLC